MVTWKDAYVEKQRRYDELMNAQQHRTAVARQGELNRGQRARASGAAAPVRLLERLVAVLRRREAPVQPAR